MQASRRHWGLKLHSGATVLLGLAALVAPSSCTRGEAEDQVASRSIPQRLLANGSIRLSNNDRAALRLEVSKAAKGELPEIQLRYGMVRARLAEEALVVSPVAGRVARPPRLALGAQIGEGSPLLDISTVLSAAERVTLGIQGADLSGQIEAASRELTTRRAEAKRAAELAESKIVSAAQLQIAETAVATTEARLEALRHARAIQLQGQGGGVTLKAPAAGTLVAMDITVGAVVRAGDVLARILKPGPRWIDIAVPPNDDWGEGYEAQSGASWVSVRLLARGAVVQADGFRYDRLEVGADNSSKFLPGQSVAVHVANGSEQGIILPESAIVPGVGQDTVYTEEPVNTFVPHAVTVVARFNGKVRISGGLVDGDPVVTRGAMALRSESVREELGAGE